MSAIFKILLVLITAFGLTLGYDTAYAQGSDTKQGAFYADPMEAWSIRTIVKFSILAAITVLAVFLLTNRAARKFNKIKLFDKVLLNQIMTENPITIRAGYTLIGAKELLYKYGICHLPVIDESNKLKGVITQRDINSFQTEKAKDSFQIHDDSMLCYYNIKDIMSKDPVALPKHATLKKAVLVMRKYGVGCIPVVDPRQYVVGIVTRSDLINITAEVFKKL